MLGNFLITSSVVLVGLLIIDYRKTRKVDFMYLILSVVFAYCIGSLIGDMNDMVYGVVSIIVFHLVYQAGSDNGKKLNA